jgi:uncharacterized flavoprotein (TIGR03862 family)
MTRPRAVAVVGGGPAGLMAAEVLAASGLRVDLYDAMPSVGRKFLLAGVGGLNLTHAEDAARFRTRYGARTGEIARLLEAFDATAVRAWAHALGIGTFTGSTGRVFPEGMKAAPLLRAWLHRLRASGVRIHVRHRWTGWDTDGALRFDTPAGEVRVRPAATLLALGGASWSRLGSDGAWVRPLGDKGIPIEPLRPANCGFDTDPPWSSHFRERFAGAPLKNVVLSTRGVDDARCAHAGECVITATGIEGGAVYALSAPLRDTIARTGSATLRIDLAPGHAPDRLAAALARPRGARSLASHLQRHAGLRGVKAGLLRERATPADLAAPARLATAIKALPIVLAAPRPIDEAISTAGGVSFEALNEHMMLRALPGVFCAGEMLDWEAPTGGYLLTGCLASGRAAGMAIVAWLRGAC